MTFVMWFVINGTIVMPLCGYYTITVNDQHIVDTFKLFWMLAKINLFLIPLFVWDCWSFTRIGRDIK